MSLAHACAQAHFFGLRKPGRGLLACSANAFQRCESLFRYVASDVDGSGLYCELNKLGRDLLAQLRVLRRIQRIEPGAVDCHFQVNLCKTICHLGAPVRDLALRGRVDRRVGPLFQSIRLAWITRAVEEWYQLASQTFSSDRWGSAEHA